MIIQKIGPANFEKNANLGPNVSNLNKNYAVNIKT
jgi:hypothetical protein